MANPIDATKLHKLIQSRPLYKDCWTKIWVADMKADLRTDRLTMLLQCVELIKDYLGDKIELPRVIPEDKSPITIKKSEINGTPYWVPESNSVISVPNPEVIPIAQAYLQEAKEIVDVIPKLVEVNNQHVADISAQRSNESETDPSDNFYESAPLGGISFTLEQWKTSIEETCVPAAVPHEVEDAICEILNPIDQKSFTPFEVDFNVINSVPATSHYVYKPPFSFIAAIPYYRSIKPLSPDIIIVDFDEAIHVPSDWQQSFRTTFLDSSSIQGSIYDPLFTGVYLNYENDTKNPKIPSAFPIHIMNRCRRTNPSVQLLGTSELCENILDVVTDCKQLYYYRGSGVRCSTKLINFRHSDIMEWYPLDQVTWNSKYPDDEVILTMNFRSYVPPEFTPNYRKDLLPPIATIAPPQPLFMHKDDVVWSSRIPGPYTYFIMHFKHNVAYYKDPDNGFIYFNWHTTPFKDALALCVKTEYGRYLVTFNVNDRERHNLITCYLGFYRNNPPIHVLPFEKGNLIPENICIRNGTAYSKIAFITPKQIERGPMRITKKWFWKILKTFGSYKEVADPLPIILGNIGPVLIDYRCPVPLLYVMLYRIATECAKAHKVVGDYIRDRFLCVTSSTFPEGGMIMLFRH